MPSMPYAHLLRGSRPLARVAPPAPTHTWTKKAFNTENQALGEFFVVVVAFKLEDAGKPSIWEFSGYRKLSTVLLCIAEQLINKSENRKDTRSTPEGSHSGEV
eukprot:bmy_13641T0